MDITVLQPLKKMIGRLSNLLTSDRSSVVGAINSLKNEVDSINPAEVVVYNYEVGLVENEEVAVFTMPLVNKGMIKGIKCLAGYNAGDFYINIYTKNPLDGGEYVYASGKVTTVLWDIMDIPFTDESGINQVYCELYNVGPDSSFTLKIYLSI